MNLLMWMWWCEFDYEKEGKNKGIKKMAPRVGLEPTTLWLTATRSADWATEEPDKTFVFIKEYYYKKSGFCQYQINLKINKFKE